MTQDELKQILFYCLVTGHFTWLVGGKKRTIGKRIGCLRPDGYRQINIGGESHLEHRLVWLYHYGYLPTKQIDHINGIKDDNRIANLREATNAENAQNLGKNKNNTSGYTGVTFDKRSGKWMAQIKKDGKNYNLGLFNTREEASDTHLKAKSNLHTFNPVPR
jgi:hypothetical protein